MPSGQDIVNRLSSSSFLFFGHHNGVNINWLATSGTPFKEVGWNVVGNKATTEW